MLLSNPYKYTFLPSFLPFFFFFPFVPFSPPLASPPLPSFFLPSLRCFSSSSPLLQIFPFFLCCPSPPPLLMRTMALGLLVPLLYSNPNPNPKFFFHLPLCYPFLYVFSPNSFPFLLHPSPIPFSPSYVPCICLIPSSMALRRSNNTISFFYPLVKIPSPFPFFLSLAPPPPPLCYSISPFPLVYIYIHHLPPTPPPPPPLL